MSEIEGPLNERLEPLWAAYHAGWLAGRGASAPRTWTELNRGIRRGFERWVGENVLIGREVDAEREPARFYAQGPQAWERLDIELIDGRLHIQVIADRSFTIKLSRIQTEALLGIGHGFL